MELVPLTPDYPLTTFDCGDDDLNKFLLNDAKPSQELRIANTFILEADDESMAQLKVLRFDDYSEEWAKFILLNRNNSSCKPAHDYDIVIGPIANDRVGVQLWKYETQAIDLPTLVHNLRNMRGITFQYFFGTERALKTLKRI